MKRVIALTALAVSLLLAAPGEAAGPKILKMAVGDPETTEVGIMGEAFKKYVEDNTGGALKVEIYYSGTLGEETETLHNVRRGALDMTCVGIANLVPFVKKLGVVTLPYIFDNVDEVLAGTSGASHDMLNAYAMEGDFRILSWVYSGFRHLSNSKHPVEKLEDIESLTIRVPQSTVMLSTYKAWKAIPVLLAWSDVFSALADGTVDGQCYGYTGFLSMNFLKANQKYLTELHYNYLLQPMVMSDRLFSELSPEWQKVLLEGGKAAQDAVIAHQKQAMNAAKDTLIVQGLKITVLDDEDEWRKAAVSTVWPEMAAFVGGKAAINAYLKSIGKAEWQ